MTGTVEEKRNWIVTRFCCTSGQCIDCHTDGHGKRRRIVHADNVTESVAKRMAEGWRSYGAAARNKDVCEHDWQEQPGEPPVDVCSSCGEVRE